MWYLRDFVDKEPVNAAFAGLGIQFSFDAEHVTVINAGPSSFSRYSSAGS